MSMEMNPTNPLFGANRLKLGIFCTNGKGASQSLVPEAYRASWAASVETAQLADRAGFEAIVPYARWKGYVDGRPTHPSGVVMDPYLGSGHRAGHLTCRRVLHHSRPDRPSDCRGQASRHRRSNFRRAIRP